MKKYYLTTAIPYTNGKPHIGHLLEYVQANTIKRYRQLIGDETLLLSGADENALKNVQAAEKEGVEINEFLSRNAKVFEDAFELFKVDLDIFQRSTDQEKHWPGVQKLWELCNKNGDIYKKSYTGLYCVGCESFKTEGELTEEGLCPDHLKTPDKVEEENYFFKLSNYQEKLIELIESNSLKIIPDNKRAEALSFIRQGLEDFSISRSNERARGVGVPVPGDETQKIYVWFDALNVYMTGIGFGWDQETWEKWWPADVHIIGKDINRFHTVYWPAMLLSAGIPLPKSILIHGFINASGGQKMSKTLGNVIDPYEIVEKYGLEPVRFYLLSQIPTDGDGEFSIERFEEVYTSNLANGLGNLVARVSKLCENNNLKIDFHLKHLQFNPEVKEKLEEFKFNEALFVIWEMIRNADRLINEEKPWELGKETSDPDSEESKKLHTILDDLVVRIIDIAFNLQPFLPETSEKILKQFSGEIKSSAPLFPRLNNER